jgi:hypothetical protein
MQHENADEFFGDVDAEPFDYDKLNEAYRNNDDWMVNVNKQFFYLFRKEQSSHLHQQ